MFKKQRGPRTEKIRERSVKSCDGCVYLKSTMFKTGKKPEKSYNCTHPDIPNTFKMKEWGGLHYELIPNIARMPPGMVETPHFCPFLNKKSSVMSNEN